MAGCREGLGQACRRLHHHQHTTHHAACAAVCGYSRWCCVCTAAHSCLCRRLQLTMLAVLNVLHAAGVQPLYMVHIPTYAVSACYQQHGHDQWPQQRGRGPHVSAVCCHVRWATVSLAREQAGARTRLFVSVVSDTKCYTTRVLHAQPLLERALMATAVTAFLGRCDDHANKKTPRCMRHVGNVTSVGCWPSRPSLALSPTQVTAVPGLILEPARTCAGIGRDRTWKPVRMTAWCSHAQI